VTTVAGLLLYFAVDMLAAILAIPYASATVFTINRVLRRWKTGPMLDAPSR